MSYIERQLQHIKQFARRAFREVESRTCGGLPEASQDKEQDHAISPEVIRHIRALQNLRD